VRLRQLLRGEHLLLQLLPLRLLDGGEDGDRLAIHGGRARSRRRRRRRLSGGLGSPLDLLLFRRHGVSLLPAHGRGVVSSSVIRFITSHSGADIAETICCGTPRILKTWGSFMAPGVALRNPWLSHMIFWRRGS